MRLIAGLLVLIAALGCGPSLEQKVVGTWKLDLAKTSVTGEKVKTDLEKKQMESVLSTFSIDLKGDKTCDVKIIFPISAQWGLEGNKLTIKPKTGSSEKLSMNGKENLEFELSSAGDSMSAPVNYNGMKGTVVFTKNQP